MTTTNFTALNRPILKGVNPGLPVIQSGYLLGRVSAGVGQVELIPVNAVLGRSTSPTGGVLGQVWNSQGGGPGVWGQRILSPNATGNNNASLPITLQTGTSNAPSIATNSGSIFLTTGAALGDGGSGSITLATGAPAGGLASSSGGFSFTSANGSGGFGGNNTGGFTVTTGNGYKAGGFTVTIGESLVSTASDITLQAGYDASGNSGNIILDARAGGTTSPGLITVGGTFQFLKITAPSSPSSGRFDLYMDTSDSNMKLKDASGNVTVLNVAPGQLVGTATNNNASAGNVGEYKSTIVLIASEVSLTTATPANVTSVSLTAGDWDVWGEVWLDAAATTVCTVATGAIDTTTGTIPSVPTDGIAVAAISFGASATISTTGRVLTISPCRVSLAGTTSMYLNIEAEFTTSTLAAYGKICARRAR